MIDIAIKAHEEKNKNMYQYNADLFNKVHLGDSKVGKM